ANLCYATRPVCRIRPTSAVHQGSCLAHINRLQGELVRKRKECEELKKHNKCLSNELHLERIFMKSESELGMRNLRNINLGLQAAVKELKQKLNVSQQTAIMYSKLAEESSLAQAEAEKRREETEAQEKLWREQQEAVRLENNSLKEDTEQLKRKLTEIQQLLAQVEKSHFESKMKLERITMEKEVVSQEKRYLEHERNELKLRLKETMEENSKCKENEISQRCRTAAAEEALEKATLLHYEAERGKRLLERDKDDKEKECEIWIKKYKGLADLLHSQEEQKLKRQNKSCQVKLKSYFLCISESNKHTTLLRKEDGTLQKIEEGEEVCFSIPVENEEKGKSTDRVVYKVTAPGSNPGHAEIGGLCQIELQEHVPARRGKKIVEYFWFPADGDHED
ncbi:hypothetical protein lerEdw1_005350, partial [Lerista edwardsae]